MSGESSASISPNDFPEVENWEDGKQYQITVEQVATGEFKVVGVGAAAPDAEAEAEAAPEEGGAPPPPPKKPSKYPNPAVAGMMGGE